MARRLCMDGPPWDGLEHADVLDGHARWPARAWKDCPRCRSWRMAPPAGHRTVSQVGQTLLERRGVVKTLSTSEARRTPVPWLSEATAPTRARFAESTSAGSSGRP